MIKLKRYFYETFPRIIMIFILYFIDKLDFLLLSPNNACCITLFYEY